MVKKTSLLFGSALLAFSFISAPLAQAQDAGIYAGQVKNPKGAVIGNISQTGTITDSQTGSTLGQVNTNGQVSAPDGTPLGVASNGNKLTAYQIAKKAPSVNGTSYAGDIKDSSGNTVATIGQDGVMTDTATSLPVGKVDKKGNVTNMAGKKLGKAAAGNKLQAFEIAQKAANSGN